MICVADEIMSRYDRIKQRRELEIELLRQYGALSSAQLTKLLNEKGVRVNKRTVERDIEELRVQGIVKANPPVGREQTYSLEKQKVKLSGYFLNKVWKEIDEIIELASDQSGLFIDEAYNRTIFLYEKLPKPLRKELQHTKENATKLVSEKIGKYEASLKQGKRNLAQEYAEIQAAKFKAIRKLIREISTLLHQYYSETEM